MGQRLSKAATSVGPTVLAAAAGLIAFAAYLRTLAPTVMWYDMGEFATTSHVLGIAHNTGYPLYILLGKLFTFLPAGDIAYRINLMSAVFASLTVAFIFLIIHELTANRAAALIGALTVAFSSTLWANATWAESYPLNAFSTVLITWLLVRWRRTGGAGHLYAAFLVLGLSLGNHRLILLVVPGMLLYLWAGRKELSARQGFRLSLLFLLGLSVYLYLPIRGAQHPALSWAQPAEPGTYLDMFLTGSSRGEYWNFAFLGRLDILLVFPRYELTAAGLALAALGVAVAIQRDRLFAAYSVLLCAFIAVLVLSYSIHNIYNYFIPAYLMAGIWIGYAADAVLSFVSSNPSRRLPVLSTVRPRLRWALAALALAALPAVLFARNLPIVDRSDDYSAYDFARTTLERVKPNSTIVTDSWTASPLWYLQLVEGFRRDVFVSPAFSAPDAEVNEFIAEQFAEDRPVYVAEGLRGDVGAVRRDYYVQPVMLNGIEAMVTDVLPKPGYKDDLVPGGSFYRVLEERPALTVETVPAGALTDVPFGEAVSLVGFSTGQRSVERGSVLRLSYYWRAEAGTVTDLQATAFFVDESESVELRHGFPLWWQSRELGGGLHPTSRWRAGEIVKEEYFVLVPRFVDPGRYYVRLRVHDGTPELAARQPDDASYSEVRVLSQPILVE